MKKVFLSLLLIGGMSGYINAQESVGGLPWSMSRKGAFVNNTVPVLNLPTPDFEKAKKEDDYNEAIGKPGKYRAALGVKTNINLSNSGNFTYLEDGSIVWRLQVSIPTALAIKIQYEDFWLPEGVTYFVQNGNKNQLIGGFDITSNANSQTMAHDMVQGDVVNLEMNIKPGVDINKIQFQVNDVFGLYRAANSVNYTFGDADVKATYGLGQSDTCQININCAQTYSWYLFTSAVAHIWITSGEGGGWCSGTLVGNTAADCKPYFLTASHCDAENAYSSPHFRFWEFTFDFRAPLCAGGGKPNTSKLLKGATFQSRSFYTIPAGQSTGPLWGDFLLLRINDANNKLHEWDRYMAGWNRSDTTLGSQWIGFHHPSGDVMKFTRFNTAERNGKFNTDSAGTHWHARAAVGGIQGGSSGSGLWEGNTGRIIGDLSGGITPAQQFTCRPNYNYSEYSKIYHNWENTYDVQFYNDSITTANSKLKPFLDPSNTGQMTLDMQRVNPSCVLAPFTPTAVEDVQILENGISLFPNPSTGIVSMTLNLEKSKNLTIEIVNILGQTISKYVIKDAALSQKANFDLSSYTNGIYLFKISSENATITKKVIIRK